MLVTLKLNSPDEDRMICEWLSRHWETFEYFSDQHLEGSWEGFSTFTREDYDTLLAEGFEEEGKPKEDYPEHATFFDPEIGIQRFQKLKKEWLESVLAEQEEDEWGDSIDYDPEEGIEELDAIIDFLKKAKLRGWDWSYKITEG